MRHICQYLRKLHLQKKRRIKKRKDLHQLLLLNFVKVKLTYTKNQSISRLVSFIFNLLYNFEVTKIS